MFQFNFEYFHQALLLRLKLSSKVFKIHQHQNNLNQHDKKSLIVFMMNQCDEKICWYV